MKNMKIAAIVLLLFTSNIFGQTTDKPIKSGSLKSQFETIIENSNSFKGYKVIKEASLQKLQSNITDSLSVSKNKLSAAIEFQNSQKQLIESLQTKSNSAKAIVSDLKSEKDNISLLGIPIQKSFFKTLFFLIVIVLIATVIFLIFKFKRSNIITAESKLALEQTEKEFLIYKEKALEREQKAMRRLQDELNKNK
ncbi:hypothetical protein [Flavobacterium algicola]|uniref:hypothetical protein n=1 Tax=Flavobacterium algicola TaxID=556529 RepID=UPI001EFE23A9|nr:hypothetical protein [Flavobacterium algicola]MCG9792627.1 hypothetical protein [Flavobacterium algicola]